MKILLDTNIVIHRETSRPINEDIGQLFRWIDNLNYKKYVHPITVGEIYKYKDKRKLEGFKIKLDSYNILPTSAPLDSVVKEMSDEFDRNQNDINDTFLLNEIYSGRLEILITEDRNIHRKAEKLGIEDNVFTIDGFLEKVTSEHPDLVDYKVLSVRKEYFGNIKVDDPFFDSFKNDYNGFEKWFRKKSYEEAYICESDDRIIAFLYLKVEGEEEEYSDIHPVFSKKKRLKIGTFKVSLNGVKLGERFLKIVFDNAKQNNVDEIYVTVFDSGLEQLSLIELLQEWGFVYHGTKTSDSGEELVFVRDFEPKVNLGFPKTTYPFISKDSNTFIVPIYPEYHTDLFPDSILRTESPKDFVENEPFRNAISKVYICRSIKRDLKTGDNIIFYRTKDNGSAYYTAVISTIGIVERVVTAIKDEEHFIRLCRKRSVFSDEELREFWRYNPRNRPFVVYFLYAYSFPKRLILKELIELGIIKDTDSVPRGFEMISQKDFVKILKETKSDESIVANQA